MLVFLNPNAELQLWARQLSPDYFLHVCQASLLIGVTMLFLLYLLDKETIQPFSPATRGRLPFFPDPGSLLDPKE